MRNKDGSERKVRRDAKLKHLADQAQRKLIGDWLAQDGVDSCLQRMRSELAIEVSSATLYDALAYWRTQERFSAMKSIAVSQAEIEAEAKGGMSPDAMEQAVDRNFLGLAAQLQDTDLYLELRHLRLADATAKTKARQKDRALAQKDEEIKLALDKFQFDGAKAALAHLAELKSIAADRALSAPEKIAAVRLKLFGTPRGGSSTLSLPAAGTEERAQ